MRAFGTSIDPIMLHLKGTSKSVIFSSAAIAAAASKKGSRWNCGDMFVVPLSGGMPIEIADPTEILCPITCKAPRQGRVNSVQHSGFMNRVMSQSDSPVV